MFTKYELVVLREAVIADLQTWNERVERGDDISPKFMATLEALETKLEQMIVEKE